MAAFVSTHPSSVKATGGSTYYVAVDGNDTWNGTSQYPWRTIQHAIDWASNSDTIIVHAGNYTENVVVNRALILQGDGSNVVNVTAVNSGDPFRVTVNDVTLSGFNATGGWDGIYCSAKHCNFLNNTLKNNRGFGIYLDTSTQYDTVEGCTASGNGWGSDGGGIWLHWSYQNTIEGCTANDNFIGIHLDNSDSNTIEGCTADNNDIGIHLDGTTDNIITDDTVSGNTEHGILLHSSENNQITGNNILSNGAADSGIHISSNSHDNLIGNNTIENNYDGIYIVGGYDNKILGNNIFNNTGEEGGGIIITPGTTDSTGNVIHLNNIGGNSFGVYCGYYNVDASNNWWGDVTGPSQWGPGSGDAVGGDNYVRFRPWLGAPLVLPAAHYEHLYAGPEQVVDASGEANTTVTLNTTDETDIVIAKYESQPFPAETFPNVTLGKYFDIFFSNPDAVVWPILVNVTYTNAEVKAAGIDESTLGLYYYQSVAPFERCLVTGVDTQNNVIWANVNATEYGYYAPGTAFGAGGLEQTNHPPVAYNQTVYATENQPKSITLNATDADGDPLTYIVVTRPSHGTLSGSPPNLIYTPNAGYHGPDSFTFKANDGIADSNIATVSITVEPPVPTPTLSQWGIIGMALVFAAALVWVGRRRLGAKARS